MNGSVGTHGMVGASGTRGTVGSPGDPADLSHVSDPADRSGPADLATVVVRYWAGARAAAGVETDLMPAGPLDAVLAAAAQRHPALAPVLPACSILIDGMSSGPDSTVPAGATVEVLPPFAGG